MLVDERKNREIDAIIMPARLWLLLLAADSPGGGSHLFAFSLSFSFNLYEAIEAIEDEAIEIEAIEDNHALF